MEVSAGKDKALPDKAKKKGGLRTIPFIISNEIFENVATVGLHANMILYLTTRYLMTAATGTIVIYIWNAVSNFLPIFGAILSDSYLGRFRVIMMASFASLFGMCLLCLTAILPVYKRTVSCTASRSSCSLVPWQLPLLFTSFLFMSIGSGGIRPCALAFSADQLDKKDNSPQNVRTLQTFFNWYYTVLGISIVVAVTVIVYIQEKKGWVIGFGVPVVLMLIAITMFLVGASCYIKGEGDRSMVIGLVQVVVASFRNRRVALPPATSDVSCYYNKIGARPRIPTSKLRYFNKACLIRNWDKDLNPDGSSYDPWTLCTVQQVEDLKAIVRVLPIWTTTFIPAVVIGQRSFPVLQAATMDRHVAGSKFQIPPASYGVFNIATLTLWVAIYDRLLVPHISKITGHPRGLTMKQRMGGGLAVMSVAMAVAAHAEHMRRTTAISQGLQDDPSKMVHMSAMWLVPQYCLTGLAEALSIIGQIEFYYSEFPKSMSSIGLSLLSLGLGFGSLLGSAIIGILNVGTKRNGYVSWVNSNLNRGHYDYYYLLLAVLNIANLLFFLVCSYAYGKEGQNMLWEPEVEELKEVKEDGPC